MGAEKYYFGTLMPYVHAAEKTGGKPGVPRPAPPAAPLAGAADAASAARVAARLRAACENATSGVSVAPDVDALGVLPASDAALDWSRGIRAAWDISEAGAEEAWSHFKRANLARYEDDASFTEEDASAVSRLSPYLRSGKSRRVACTTSCPWRRNPPDRGPVAEQKGLERERQGTQHQDRPPAEPHVLAQAVPPRVRVLAARALAAPDDTRSVRAHYEDRADWRLAWTEADDKRVAARGDYWVYDRERPKKTKDRNRTRVVAGSAFGEEDVPRRLHSRAGAPARPASPPWTSGCAGCGARAGCTRRSA